MNNLFNLKNKVAIVTGGYGHLGKGIVDALLVCGAKVVVAGRSKEKFDIAFKDYNFDNLFFEYIDITDSEIIKECYSNVMSAFGEINILINNAHTAKGKSQLEMSDADWSYTMDGVVGSIHKSIKAIAPYMVNQGFGKIVNITSMYGLVSPNFKMYKGEDCEKYTNPPHYGAAKAAMIQLTKYYAVLLGENNINVNAISPGPFPKKIIQKENPVFIKRLKTNNPLHRIGKPSDIAGTIALLSSSASDFITGQIIQIDGGWTLW